ncbi:hypothetical protein [Pelosinus propionicus]|uniref:Uncharacterized protein n=1 Tax=Pelosinus propionicus DSM 13327 TaxID=1123291 RepID=A0A1I4P2R5_9FIRM|nr:hypothetical protein [Pelosinus propionicus]SFM21955.1 hypothetical protein SAMN04490355_105635 [Pelosinus propionicus DSM 13327]
MANANIIIPGEMAWRTTPRQVVLKRVEPEDPTPIECVRKGLSLYRARPMYPQELTPEDAQVLLESKVSKILIAASYQMATSDLYKKLIEWGIHKKGSKKIFGSETSKEMESVPNQLMTPAECIINHISLENAQRMSPEDLTQEDATLILKAGHGPSVLLKYYSFKSPGGLYYKLEKWGLHKKKHKVTPSAPKVPKKEEESSSPNVVLPPPPIPDPKLAPNIPKTNYVSVGPPYSKLLMEGFEIANIAMDTIFFSSPGRQRPSSQIDFILELLVTARDKVAERRQKQ